MVKIVITIVFLFFQINNGFSSDLFDRIKGKIIYQQPINIDSVFTNYFNYNKDSIISVDSKIMKLNSINFRYENELLKIVKKHFEKEKFYEFNPNFVKEVSYEGSINKNYHLFSIYHNKSSGLNGKILILLSSNKNQIVVSSTIISMDIFFASRSSFNSFFIQNKKIIINIDSWYGSIDRTPNTFLSNIKNYSFRKRKILLGENGRMKSKFIFYKKYPKMKVIF